MDTRSMAVPEAGTGCEVDLSPRSESLAKLLVVIEVRFVAKVGMLRSPRPLIGDEGNYAALQAGRRHKVGERAQDALQAGHLAVH